MVCVRVAFHENDGNHENDENDKDNSDSYEQGVECWIREAETTKMTKTTGIQGANHSEIPKRHRVYTNFSETFARTFAFFPVTRVRNPTEICSEKLVQTNSFILGGFFSGGFSSSENSFSGPLFHTIPRGRTSSRPP